MHSWNREGYYERRAAQNSRRSPLGAGQIVGLLGPNGAGKSTTVSLVAGLLRPDAGEVRIAGRVLRGDDDALKRSVGLCPQDLALYEDLSAQANLRFFGALFGMRGEALERALAVALGRVGLESRASQRVKTMSGGMKRRLNLAAGLLHDPDLLLLDEPTVGSTRRAATRSSSRDRLPDPPRWASRCWSWACACAAASRASPASC